MNRGIVLMLVTTSAFALSACGGGEKIKLSDYNPFKAVEKGETAEATADDANGLTETIPTLGAMIGSASAKVDVDAGFTAAMRQALASDPLLFKLKMKRPRAVQTPVLPPLVKILTLTQPYLAVSRT